MNQQLVFLIALLLQALQTACRSKGELVLENLALRQQVTALKQKHPQPHLHDNDRVFWLALRRGWARWADLLVIVKPETVVDWHRRRFRVLYVFFVIDHGRRHILHFNATYNPTAQWVVQQLREAFPFDTAPKYLIFDRDSIFNKDVVRFIKSVGTKPSRTAYRSPWQNPVAER